MARAGGGMSYSVSGVKEIQRAYQLLPKKVANKVIRQAVRTALKPVLIETKAQAPKGKTLALSRSVKLRVRTGRKRGVIAYDVRIGDGDFLGETFYAAMVEYGTKKQQGQHYMEAAFDSRKEDAARTAVELVAAGVAREWQAL